MRIFIALLVLIFTLQSFTKADDITEFQIEGISIGDSALDFFSEKQIKNNIMKDYFNDDLYSEAEFSDASYKSYDGISINFKTKDKNFIVHGISAHKFMNLSECFVQRKELEQVMTQIWPNTRSEKYDFKHPADKSGKSHYYHILFSLYNDEKIIGNAVIECLDWSQQITDNKGWTDNMSLRITTEEFEEWLRDKAYN